MTRDIDELLEDLKQQYVLDGGNHTKRDEALEELFRRATDLMDWPQTLIEFLSSVGGTGKGSAGRADNVWRALYMDRKLAEGLETGQGLQKHLDKMEKIESKEGGLYQCQGAPGLQEFIETWLRLAFLAHTGVSAPEPEQDEGRWEEIKFQIPSTSNKVTHEFSCFELQYNIYDMKHGITKTFHADNCRWWCRW